MRLNNYINLILCSLFLFSCNKNEKRIEVQQIVSEWTEKKIKFKFSNDVPCCVLGKDTTLALCSNLFLKEYKILLYVDSTGCSSCRLKLFQWKQLIEEADSLFEGRLSFLLFFQPKNKKEIRYIFQKDLFDYPVFIDMNNTINSLNHFPDKPEFQCFLLDQDNKVLMVGNPVLNPKIWELYKQTITSKKDSITQPVTSVSIVPEEIEIPDLSVGKKSHAAFKIKNTGKAPFIIYSVDASCGCTVPVWEKQPVASGSGTEIRLEIQPEETGVFHKTLSVYGNVSGGIIKVAVKVTVK